MKRNPKIQPLTETIEDQVARNPLLNIDTFIIPSPYIRDPDIEKDREYSCVWVDEGEILGYMLVYTDRYKRNFHIYKLVTSPFGRGRGIGTAFIEYLASKIPGNGRVYLYIWEKQGDTIEFFQNKGFHHGEPMVYRNLVYCHLLADKHDILIIERKENKNAPSASEEIGKTRHDARKTLRLMSNMVDMLAMDNADRIIEDINRESTTMSNMLNSFRDSLLISHTVNLQDVILERIIPYIEASTTPCDLHLELKTREALVPGSFVNIGRALINMASNSLDAITDTGRNGVLRITLLKEEDYVLLELEDNGTGIPEEKLIKDSEGLPAFVGRTTKGNKTGEGLGTRQIYATFGTENIKVISRPGAGTIWQIRLKIISGKLDKWHIQMERRLNEFKVLWEKPDVHEGASRNAVIASIWQLRKMEIFLFDLILKFSKFHNIRVIFRTVLSYVEGALSWEKLNEEVSTYRCEDDRMKLWLLEITQEIKSRKEKLLEARKENDFLGAMFKSYGQALKNIIIFTLDPETGNFRATDRKLAEHLDFAPYLGKDKEQLVRGEFIGDMNIDSKPIILGVWTVRSDEDLMNKLQLIRSAAKRLLEMGIHPTKKLSFYQTTYIRHTEDIDSNASCTFQELSECSDEDLKRFTRPADDEFQNFFAAAD
ncbi:MULTISPECIES: GNAT family N-acetyltransferase [unclassified Oceanispirochaeta]|uniref:GNAT family N-acetyltransferase n=1 Tax=unclassified Oceanispirochaeta TaxID=2635722 RepID=UPI000E08E9EB|nr:GNAT family N-acetyltransferase [Oceanispirochaeta sp. M1]MBF9016631.1 GNAT family N-acetyltransferase [Oceanispirochaeta sp. M2]NPD73164.1 GNAT family N-acetyltransferase [Oceanispirochaeta sp. M1]RDG31260.1 GNAT family N-acetyltransferase [Oceanispirochaeta sp. M1]